MNCIRSSPLAVLAFLATVLLFSCKSDPAASNSSGNANVAPDAAGALAAPDQQAPSTFSDPAAAKAAFETLLEQAQKLSQEHEAFRQKVKALRDEFNTIPPEVKKNAVHTDELESRIEGFLEKGGFRTEELNQAIEQMQAQLKTGGKAGAGDVAWDVSPYQPVLKEHQGAIAEINAAYAQMRKAVDQLKASIPTKGKGVVLFQ